MSSGSKNEGEVSHYAYLVLINFPPFPTEISKLCNHAKTNDIFLPDSRVGPSPFSKTNKVEICVLETLILRIGLRLPTHMCSQMHL
jgi:hypothetical protein